MKTIDIKGKPYIEVNERIKFFRENFKDWALESDIVSLDNGVCVIKATVKNPEGIIKATGYAYEKEDSTFINKTSYIENCETSAWGRALGNLGIGIDTSIASAEEVLNATLNQDKPKAKPKKPEAAKQEITEDDRLLIGGVKECKTTQELEGFYKEISPMMSCEDAKKELIKQCKARKEELTNGK